MTVLRVILMFLVIVVVISVMMVPNVSTAPMYVGRKANVEVSGAWFCNRIRQLLFPTCTKYNNVNLMGPCKHVHTHCQKH